MKGKKILILGAGTYQVPLIKEAKGMGLETHVASIPGPYPGIEVADFFHPINISDIQGILDLSREIQFDAILTTGSDVCVPAIGAVVDELGLIGTGSAASIRSMDKIAMKEAFQQNSVPSPDFLAVTNSEEALSAANKIGFPCVIKAVDSSGSRGVTVVEDSSGIVNAVNRVREVSKSHFLIVEEYISGEEYGAQAIIVGGEIKKIITHSDLVTKGPFCIPVGHCAPHENEDLIIEKTSIAVASGVCALGIDHCIANVDLFWTDRGPMIIEIGARMGGTCLPEICGGWWGVNMYQIALKISLGEDIELPKSPMGTPTAAHILWSMKSGVVEAIPEVGDEFDVLIDVAIGDRVEKFTSGNLRIGHVIGNGETSEEASELVYSFARELNKEIVVGVT